jgi:putative membrane protein
MGNWDGYGMMYGNQWGAIFGFIFMMVILALVVVGAVILSRRFLQDGSSGKREIGALEILNQRYAKGEITQEEYRTIKKEMDLGNK